jgi:uncharacterized cupredoxin-like copper-binding protein
VADFGLFVRLGAPVVAVPLLVLVPRSATAVDWSMAQKVRVVAADYTFRPADLTFRQGVAYRLRVDNRGTETHEFTAPDFFKTIDVRDWKPLNADHTEIVVQPGRHKDFYFVAKQAGAFKLTCSDHDWAGMVGDITVVP